FQGDWAKIAVMKLSAGKLARIRADQHSPGLRHRLQARGEVRRLTNDGLLRRSFLDQKLSYDYSARRNPGANLQRCRDIPNITNAINDCECSVYSPFGIIFMCLRITEIDQHTIAHIAGYLSAKTAYDFCDTAMIRANQ